MNKLKFFALALSVAAVGCSENAADSAAAAVTEQVQPVAEAAAAPVADVSAAVEVGTVFNDMRADHDAYKTAHEGKSLMVSGVVDYVDGDVEAPSVTLKAATENDKWDGATIKFAKGTDLSEIVKLTEDESQYWVITLWAEGTFDQPIKINKTGRLFDLTEAKLLKFDKKAEEE